MNITPTLVSERDRALLGGDYHTYHTQNVRRIHTLRRRLGNATPRGRKYAAKGPVTAQDVGKNLEWVHLLLANAERAWAHAMAMKTSQSPENTQKQMLNSTKNQIISRYRRATSYASNLVEALHDRSTSGSNDIDVLEAQAYLSLLKGGLAFEKQKWEACIQQYSVARLVYQTLAASEKTDVYRDLLSATVDPSIRFAAHQLKLPRTKAVSDLAIEHFPASESDIKSEILRLQADAFTPTELVTAEAETPSSLPSSITWRGRQVKIEDASISQPLGLANDRERALQDKFRSYQEEDVTAKELANAYDDVINARQDAADVTKSSIDELRAEGVDQGDPRIQVLQITRTAINFSVIECRIGRNRVLCGRDDGLSFDDAQTSQTSSQSVSLRRRTLKEESTGKKLTRLREQVALYDQILQSIDVVKELPGVIADTDFVTELETKRSYFRALKCFAIGRSHALNGAVTETLALYARAAECAQQASTGSKLPDTVPLSLAKFSVSRTQVRTVEAELHKIVLRYRALANLNNLIEGPIKKKTYYEPPLLERMHLNRYEDNIDLTNLVNYPPKLQPVPAKPLFFDLAWNYIQYPGRELQSNGAVPTSVTAEPPKEESKTAKRGWFGFGGR